MNQILTPSGYIDIHSVNVGDEVLAYDLINRERVINTIKDIDYPAVDEQDFILVNNTWNLYKNQSVWVNGNVSHAGDLKPGDVIYDEYCNNITVTSLTPATNTKWVRFQISNDHSFIADGLSFHNSTRYWVGGTGTWDTTTTTHWASASGGAGGASVPGASDAVIFDAGSGGGTVTPNYDFAVTSITMGAFMGTLDFSANNNSPTIVSFSGTGTGTRTLNMGNGTWSVTGNNNNVWNLSVVTNLTLNCNGSTLKFTYSGSTGTRGISTGASGIIYKNILITAGSDIISQSGNFTITGNFSTSGFTGTYSKTTNSLTVGGDFTLGAGSTWSSISGTVTLTSAGSVNINTNGVNINQAFTINGTGSFALQNDLDCSGSNSTTFTVTQGTFNANNFNITVAIFNSSNSNLRTINMGSGTWTITGNGTTVWTLNTSANLTFNCNTSTLKFTYSGSTGTRTIGTGSTLVYFNFYITGGSDTIVIASVFCNNFNTTGFTGIYSKTTATVSASGNFIVGAGSTWSSTSGTITLTSSGSVNINTNGVNINQSFTINGTGSFTLQSDLDCSGSNSTALIVTQGTFNANNFNITVAIFNSSNSNVRTINMGSGIWTITGNGTTVWTLNIATNLTFNCNISTLKFAYPGSTGSRTIGTGTNAVYYNFYITAGSDTVSIGLLSCKNFNTTGFAGIYSKTTTNIVTSGDFILGAGSTWSSTSGTITLNTAGVAVLNTNGVNINQSITVAATGTVTLMSDLDMTGSVATPFTLTSGTFNANNFNITAFSFLGSGTGVRSLNMGNGIWSIFGNGTTVWTMATITNLTFNASGSTLKFTYSGSTGTRTVSFNGNLTYNKVMITAGSDTFAIANLLATSGDFSCGGFTGTMSKTAQTMNIGGNFTVGAGCVWSSTGGTINLTSSGSVDINTHGINVNQSFNVNGSGTFTLQNNLDISGAVSTTLTVTAGTFVANNFDVKAGFFSSNNSNIRTVNMGAGTWTLTGSGGAAWNLTTITNLNMVIGTSSILFINTDSGVVTMNTGGGTILYNIIAFNRGAGGGSNAIAGNLNCNNFSDTGTAAHTLTVNNGNTITVNNSWNVTGAAGNLITLTSSAPATGTFNLINMSGTPYSSDYLNIQHSIATPGNYWLAGLNSVNNQYVPALGAGWAFSSQPVMHAGFLSFM